MSAAKLVESLSIAVEFISIPVREALEKFSATRNYARASSLASGDGTAAKVPFALP
jgi:hypothetical protein